MFDSKVKSLLYLNAHFKSISKSSIPPKTMIFFPVLFLIFCKHLHFGLMDYGKCKVGIKMFISRVPGGSQLNNHIKHFSFAVHWVSTNPIRFWLGLACRHTSPPFPEKPPKTPRKNIRKPPEKHTQTQMECRKSVAYFAAKISSSQFACHNSWLKFSLFCWCEWAEVVMRVYVCVCVCVLI